MCLQVQQTLLCNRSRRHPAARRPGLPGPLPSPPPAGTAGSAGFPPPVPDCLSPPASLPAAAAALAPGRRAVESPAGLPEETPGSRRLALPPPSAYLSLQAAEGAGLCLWQLTEEDETGLRSRLGGLAQQPSIPTTGTSSTSRTALPPHSLLRIY